jgi:cell fate regulator YaaT (PSP1 superfamily)
MSRKLSLCLPNCKPVYNLQQNGLSRKTLISQIIQVGQPINYANSNTANKWKAAKELEHENMHRARTIALQLKLNMKLSDVDYQGDKTKATFYYTADDRVDFRELIKKLAERFRVKIEMKQIGYRAEAGRLGGIGSCGRELCCSTWLTDFRAVSTGAARYQQLSLNPSKLAGQCGKLKCCLNYELDQYVEAVRDLPPTHLKLRLPKGSASHFKTDIFKRIVYYTLDDEPGGAPFALPVEQVFDILDKNKKGVKLEVSEDIYRSDKEKEKEKVEVGFAQVVGQDSLTRFDKNKKKGNKPNNKRQGGGNRPGANSPNSAPKPPSGQKSPANPSANKGNGAPKKSHPPRPNHPPKKGPQNGQNPS